MFTPIKVIVIFFLQKTHSYFNHAKFVKRMCITFYRKRKQQQQQHGEETNQVKIQAKMTENLLEN